MKSKFKFWIILLTTFNLRLNSMETYRKFDQTKDMHAYEIFDIVPKGIFKFNKTKGQLELMPGPEREKFINNYNNLIDKYNPNNFSNNTKAYHLAQQITQDIELAKECILNSKTADCTFLTIFYNYRINLKNLESIISSNALQSLNINIINLSNVVKNLPIDKNNNYISYKINNTEIRLIKANILDLPADAIVNPANEACLGGGGLDGQITAAGGEDLREARENIPQVRLGVRCPVGESRITRAGDLKYLDPNTGDKVNFKYVFHTVGPVCKHKRIISQTEEKKLISAYINTIVRAIQFNKDPKNTAYIEFPYVDTIDLEPNYKIKSLSIPPISTGIFKCDTDNSAEKVSKALVNYLNNKNTKDLKVINLVFFDPGSPSKADRDFDNYKKALDRFKI